MSWFLAIAGFCVLIILHEFGHFAAAKAVGMRVERFMLFFPPILGKVKLGETEYGIGAIPAGGYVKITGMNPAEEIPPEHAHRAYYRQPVWKRVVVISAGPLMNVLIAFVLIVGLFMIKGELTGVSNQVAAIEKGYPANGQLHLGDRVVAVDGKRLKPEDVAKAISAHKCAGRPTKGCAAATPVRFTVVRDGHTRTLTLTPIFDPSADGGKGRTRLGFGLGPQYETVGFGQAATDGVSGMWRVTTGTVDAITRIFYDSQARKEVSGVVGSTKVVQQSFHDDQLVQALQLLALVSLSLAIVNLFPFLPLDGGHIFWAVAEKVRGRPIPFRVMEQASYVGFVLVIMLFVVGLTNDIDRLRGDGFGVR
jgi:regulator of sigma E protease